MAIESNETQDYFDSYGSKFREEVFSKAVRAGKRTYFFDVKATRNDELYLNITESKKKIDHNGNAFYEKHKIFLYKEDFEKFIEGLTDIVDYINLNQPLNDQFDDTQTIVAEFSSVDFDDI